MRRLAALVLALALAGCPPRRPPDLPRTQFWSLVKVTTEGSSFAFKCLHAQEPQAIRIRCFTPVEIPLFDIDIEGNAVSVQAASEAVTARIPFDISRIGTDVWRVHVALTDGDLAGYDALNDPDLPEDHIEVVKDAEGRPLEKTFFAGEETAASASFLDYDGVHAGRILFESVDPAYALEIVQGEIAEDPH
ncbi:MAG: hypothetical protein JRG91_03045 [Deltaproteobacteria bacterium]|nr:hypothetical protein [Deltaproteobacteria bacterium]